MGHSDHHTGGCGCADCGIEPFTRNHYFTGKLLVERDFRDEQRYYIDKLRHHHQRLHGWGVACGLKVTPHDNAGCRSKYVYVEPGTAIDACGHEIIVRDREVVDLLRLPAIRALAESGDTEAHTIHICVRYRECPAEEIPVLYDECGCDDTRCAPNRILESFEFDAIVDPDVPDTEDDDSPCSDKWWSNLNGCADADVSNCVVLASLTEYRVGDSVEVARDRKSVV